MMHEFVGRHQELKRLYSFLNESREGNMQICFVTGEAGAGKTTLINEFIRQSQEFDEKLIFVKGNCNAQTGISDPYLPFRQILGMLIGNETHLDTSALTDKNPLKLKEFLKTSGRVLIEIAPELIGTLLPLGGILAALARMGAQERGLLKGLEKQVQQAGNIRSQIDQSQIFLQYTALLRTLSREFPLVIILDDVHWIDDASNALLFHLFRELQRCPIFLIGLYRPNDVAARRNNTRHPLEQTINEIRRYYGDVFIDLDRQAEEEGRTFVNAILAQYPNHFSVSFRQALYQQTRGHALFTVELVRKMQESGDLVQDSKGAWHETSTLNWEKLPAKIEAIIEERINRLTKDLREILNVASVEGQIFSAQVIAKALEIKEGDLIRTLSRELKERHQLIHEKSEIKLGRIILSQYTFNHSLFQLYLYNSLSKPERRLLHADVAQSLEIFFSEHIEEISVQLAYHYQAAGRTEKAINYLRLAGEAAFRIAEYNQARQLFAKALNMLNDDTSSGSKKDEAYLLWLIGETYYKAGRWKASESKYRRSLEVAHLSDDNDAVARGMIGLAQSLRGQFLSEQAALNAQEAIEITQQTGNLALKSQGLRELGIIYGQLNRIDERLALYEEALQIAVQINNIDLEMRCLNSLGVVQAAVGNHVKAIEYFEKALTLAVDNHRQAGQIQYLINLFTYQRIGDYEKASYFFDKYTKLCNKIGDSTRMALSNYHAASLYFHTDNIDKAIEQLIRSIQLSEKYERITIQVRSRCWLAIIYLFLNKPEVALIFINELQPLLAKYKTKSQVFSERIIEAITQLRLGNLNKARELFENEFEQATQLLHTKRWSYPYHKAFAHAGITLLASQASESADVTQTLEYFQAAVAYCGWAGILDDALLILRELCKVDTQKLLKPIENYLLKNRELLD